MDIQLSRANPRNRTRLTERQAYCPFRSERRSLPNFTFIYLGLAFALISSVVITDALESSNLVQRYGPNLTTELLGIIATLTFVQRLLAREERTRKLRASVGPLRKSCTALTDFLQGWSTLLKGSFDPQRTEMPRSFQELLTSHYTNDLASLDPKAADDDAATWAELGIRQLVNAQVRLREVIAIYSATLDPDYLEAVHELADDPFVQLLEDLAGQAPTAREWRVAINQSRGLREGHFVRLIHALTIHNSLSSEAARFRSRHLAPSAHSLTIQLRADYDLTVPLKLGREWWSAAPVTGKLRMS